MIPRSAQPESGKVFLLALDGVEIFYLPGRNEIISVLEPVAPNMPAPAAPPARRDTKPRP